MLRAQDITKRFGPDTGLNAVSLDILPGEITAVIGPSGSGKSTLIRALSLLDPPTSGSLDVDARSYTFPLRVPVTDDPPWPELGVVFQQLFLWPHLTLRQNVMLPLELRGLASEKAHASALLDYFELDTAADRYPNETSLGQRQRAAFVRALVLKPKYLLLDEITSALDVEHVGKVLIQLRELRTQAVGILIVTHLLGFASRSADQIVFLDRGAIVELGPAAILAAPRSERLKQFLSLAETAT